MEWCVICDNWNSRKIETYNIFKHSAFHKEVIGHLKKCEDKSEFANELRSSLRYYFWSKAEWEILVVRWVFSTEDKERKIDVYDQVMLNWNVFVDYVWSFKKGIKD